MSEKKTCLPAIEDLKATRKNINEVKSAEELDLITSFADNELAQLINEQNKRFAGGTLAILPHGISYQRFAEYMTEKGYSVKPAGTNYGQQLVDICW